jgi:small conductance mechanosensitive channel
VTVATVRSGIPADATPSQAPDTAEAVGNLADRAQWLLSALPLVALALLALILGWVFGGWLSRRAILGRLSRDNPFLQDLIRTAVRWGTVLAGVLVALDLLGATRVVGAVLGTAGVLGVALGFAFKDILENYLAGLLLSLRQPFAPQDWVEIDGNEGIVVALTSRATILMTLSGNHLRLPNAKVFRGVILNYTRNPKRRLGVRVGIGVGEDIAHAQHAGIAALRDVPGVLDDPPPRALVLELGDWSVTLDFTAWVDQQSHDFLLVQSEAARTVKEALDSAGVEMPYPTYRIGMQETPGRGRGPAGAEDSPAMRPAAPRPVLDTRRTDDVIKQVEAQRRRHGGSDLLDDDAPRELE